MSKDFVSPEDKALFRMLVQTVKPLKKSKQADHEPFKANARGLTEIVRAREKRVPILKIDKPEFATSSAIHLSNFYADAVNAETTLSWCQHSIPHKRFMELKQGRIRWDSKLDLHGLRTDNASQTLLDFISREQTRNHRCLLIIHGKGNHKNEAPVLKNLVNHWLRQIPQVLAFHSAVPKDGGNGALYVLLKRNREF